MAADRADWVEIIEPKTKEHMYANLITGECVWDPPQGVNVKRTDSSQWWELFDNATQRFYYYNATTQTTVWHRPLDCDIIPLAKLQTLKQNTDPLQRRRESSTQTGAAAAPSAVVAPAPAQNDVNGKQTSPGRRPHHHRCAQAQNDRRPRNATGTAPAAAAAPVSQGLGRRGDSGRSSDSSVGGVPTQQPLRRLQDAPVQPQKSVESRLSGEPGGSISRATVPTIAPPLPASSSTPQLKKKKKSQSQQSSPLAQPAPTADVSADKWGGTGLNRSGSFMSPRKDASDDSMHEKYFKSVESTPLSARRKVTVPSPDGAFPAHPYASCPQAHHNQPATGASSCESSPQSPDNGPPHYGSQRLQPRRSPPLQQASGRPSLVSSISLATDHPSSSLGLSPGPPRPHPAQQQSLDRTGHHHHHRNRDGAPRHNLERGTRDRYSDRYLDKERIEERAHPGRQDKPSYRQTSLDFRHSSQGQPPPMMQPTKGHGSPADVDGWSHKDITRRQQAEPEAIKSGKSRTCSTPDSHSSKSSHHHQESIPPSSVVSGYGMKSLSLEQYLTKPNIEKHNMEIEKERHIKGNNRMPVEKERISTMEKEKVAERKPKQRRAKPPNNNMDTLESGSGCENGNTSPLYSNWDLNMQHLLPLQHYILEQAKLSGCYRLGDPLGAGSGDSESLHSSGSESGSSARSLSGHEPDNEDSDRSGSNDGYLQHQPPPAPMISHQQHHREDDYMNHDVAYYNTFVGLQKDAPHHHYPPGGGGVHRSASGFMPSNIQSAPPPQPICEALYSPVKSHPVHHTPKDTDIEKFAQDNLNLHSKGIFRKKASVRDMLSWTASGISGPMLGARHDKTHKKAAAEMFRLVQIYMGDRKARPGMTLNSVAIDILHAAFNNPLLRDELFVQLCRQTTENPQRDSLLRGWELLAVSLAFVPPSPAFQPPLLNYMNRHRDPAFADTFPEVGKWPIHVQVSHYAGVACRRLERIGQCGKRQPRKPTTEDIDQARIQIFRVSMFGNTLTEVMALQKDRFPNSQLPWVQVALSQQVLVLQGKQTEGIFRVSADVDEVNALKLKLDNWELPDHSHVTDAHAPASLLKLWYRELYEPLIPDTLYAECVSDPDNTEKAFEIIQRLPRINRLVLSYLVSFLQQFAAPEVVTQTKMDSANLAMVFAPNCLRCTSQDPRVILDNARKEMTFMRCLILNMDTSQVGDLV